MNSLNSMTCQVFHNTNPANKIHYRILMNTASKSTVKLMQRAQKLINFHFYIYETEEIKENSKNNPCGCYQMVLCLTREL